MVIPLYNEEQVLPKLMDRLIPAVEGFTDSFEILFVDDGSRDSTRQLLSKLAAKNHRVKVIGFSRNFGHQAAITAGMHYSKGNAVIVMDGDLQDPPELLEKMYAAFLEGFEIVYGVREKRKERIWKKVAYWVFYRLLAFLSRTEIPLDTGDFCLMSRRVVDRLDQMPERCRFLRGLRAWVGFKQTQISFVRETRLHGDPKFTLKKLLGLAFDGIFTMSEVPLRISLVIGVLVSGMSFLWGLYVLLWKLSNPGEHVGFASLAIAISFFSGLQLIFFGILGEYVARIHMEVKSRPIFLTDVLLNFEDETAMYLDKVE